ncbi:MAG: hypothetical protein NZ578_08455 [Candidatus Binatia bacterium]|nr:hypothetical protein [Candidatus Binatia bacterium]
MSKRALNAGDCFASECDAPFVPDFFLPAQSASKRGVHERWGRRLAAAIIEQSVWSLMRGVVDFVRYSRRQKQTLFGTRRLEDRHTIKEALEAAGWIYGEEEQFDRISFAHACLALGVDEETMRQGIVRAVRAVVRNFRASGKPPKFRWLSMVGLEDNRRRGTRGCR